MPKILLSALAIIVFLFITNTFSFKDRLFNALFPKPPSHAAVIIKPIQLTAMYQGQKYASTGISLTGAETTQKFSNIVSLPDDNAWANAKAAGFSGPFMYYILFDQTEGPSGLDTLTAQTKTCSTLGKSSYVLKSENSATAYYNNDFCQIHDSIVNKTAFDHDLDSNTPAITATEGWFLHDLNGVRITFNQDTTVYYAVNPSNLGWREYFITRLFRDLNFNVGDKINELGWLSKIKATGIYLDNILLNWSHYRNNSNNHSNPKEFSDTYGLRDAVFAFVQQVHTRLHNSSKGYDYPLWANMLGGDDTGSDWDRFIPYLEGGLKEDFALNWGAGPYSAILVQNQMTQIEKWVGNSKQYIGVAQTSTSTLDRDFKFSFATLLIVTNGTNISYKLSNDWSYTNFYEFPEYYFQLGAPKGAKFQKSQAPLVFRRDFECGFAELDLTNKLGTINYTQGCIPGGTPTPVPSATPSADLIKPTVSITSPLNGAIVARNSNLTINASASDNVKVSKVEFYVGTSLLNTDTTTPYSYSYKISGKRDASYTYRARAHDTSGNVANSSPVSVTTK